MNLHVILENRNPKVLHTGYPNWPGPSLLRRLTAPSSITEGRIIWLLLWPRDPLPLPLQPLQAEVGRPWKSFHCPWADTIWLATCWSLHRPRDPTGTHSKQGCCQAPASTPGNPPTPTHGSAAPWAPQRWSAPFWDTPPSCLVFLRPPPQGWSLHFGWSGWGPAPGAQPWAGSAHHSVRPRVRTKM